LEEYLAYTTEETEKMEVMQLASELDGSIELAIKHTDCIIPIGRRLIVTITNNPILVSQKAQPINLSSHWRSGYRPLRTNIINPIPKIPYTPNRAA
jgi:hypothetical protein